VSEESDLLHAAARARAARLGPCPDAERIVAFYRGTLDPAGEDAMREHLALCAPCRALAVEARQFLGTMGEPSRTAAEPARWRHAAWATAASLILVAALAGGAWWALDQRRPWRDFATVPAAYPLESANDSDLVFRGEGADESLAEAMAAYRRGDYAGAERRLAARLRESPDDRAAQLYRGVALVLLRRAPEAIAPLAEAAEHGEPALAAEARWYLALARLEAGAREAAIADLRRLAADDGQRRAAARELLHRLGAR
jgi:hypothetical protein